MEGYEVRGSIIELGHSLRVWEKAKGLINSLLFVFFLVFDLWFMFCPVDQVHSRGNKDCVVQTDT